MYSLLLPIFSNPTTKLSEIPRVPKLHGASGYALNGNAQGLDRPFGFLGLSQSFIPQGKVKDLFDHAMALDDRNPDVLRAAQAVAYAVPHSRVLVRHLERQIVDPMQHACLDTFWPSKGSSSFRCQKSVAGYDLCSQNEVDFSRCLTLSWRTDSGNTKAQEFVTFALEVKETTHHVSDGIPQAFLAGASAALSLREAGVALADCVVPVAVSNGISEQHGAVYLLDPAMPCYVATSKVLDVMNGADLLLAAKYRITAKQHTEQLEVLLRDRSEIPFVSTISVAALSCTNLFIKVNTASFFGSPPPANATASTSFHELTIFQRLSSHNVTCVVYPLGRLMQAPAPHARAPNLATWDASLCTVYPDISSDGYKAGYHAIDSWLTKVTHAVRQLHNAGVVHGDLFPCNIMSKWTDGGDCLDVKLVDLDVSLLLTEFIPHACEEVLNYNGYKPMYHPGVTSDAQTSVDFDLWFLAAYKLQLQADYKFDPAWWVSRPDCETFKSNPADHTDGHQMLKQWFTDHTRAILSEIGILRMQSLESLRLT